MGTIGNERESVDEGRPLPGAPRTWRELRIALKHLIVRAELTAVAVEKLSNDPEVRRRGAVSIADSTISRKLADRDEPVDARSLRTIVTACRVAAERKGRDLSDADVGQWLAARTRLAEGSRPAAVPTPATSTAEPAAPAPADLPAGVRSPTRWAAALVGLAALVIAGAAVWVLDDRRKPGVAAADPSSEAPGCAQPVDKPVTAGLTIATPVPGILLQGDATEARGTVTLVRGERPPWLMLFAPGVCQYYLEQPVIMSGVEWTSVIYVDPTQHGTYVVYIVAVNAADDDMLHRLAAAGGSPSIPRLPPSARFVNIAVRCCA
jgi:hypothetical protein